MIQELFSYVCGQGRCFVVDGMPMPLCQRCLGLYIAVVMTCAGILSMRTWQAGLPSARVAYAHIAMLLAALAGGIHIIDLGPTWRFMCGAWTGHVAILWLIGATSCLHQRRAPNISTLRSWSSGDSLCQGALLILLMVMPLFRHRVITVLPNLWAAVAIAGLVLGGGLTVLAVTMMLTSLWSYLPKRC